jgi:hypothetical protein
VEVENVATCKPATVARLLLPNVAVPSLNVTVPVGACVPLVVTVAVNVTDAPCVAGFRLETSVVVVVTAVIV